MSEDALIECNCPHCKSALTFLQQQARYICDCPSCDKPIVVPDSTGETCGKIVLPIRTERLVIRPLREDDRDELLEFMSDENAFQLTDHDPLTEEEVDAWLAEAASPKLSVSPASLSLGIELSTGGPLIGYARINLMETEPRLAAIWLMIGAAHRKKGVGSEATSAILHFVIKILKRHRVSVGVDCRNAAALRMFEKAGMRVEGEFLQAHFVKGEWRDTAWFGLLEKDLEGS